MHVLHLIYSMEIGGAETMLVDIMNRQIETGLQVSLAVVNSGINEKLMSAVDPRVKVIRMNRREGSAPLLMMLKLNIMIMRLRPDVIHAHHHKFCRLVQWRKSRLIYTVHDMNTPMQYAAGSRMVAITDAVRADVLARVPDARITTIHNGIRTKAIARRGKHNPGEIFRIVQVARLLSEKKGQDILIEALGILKRRGIRNVEVTFIGCGPDESALQDLADKQEVKNQIIFAGLRDREYIYTHLSEFDAMCHPSRYEGFGLIIPEAMSAGLPLLLTEGDGPWEVADKGRLCLSFGNGDSEGCADAIAGIMNDYTSALARAEAARAFVERYDISRTVDNYTALYRTLI